MAYTRPKKRIHRGFIYLDDDTVTNSLSASESGKIDEILGTESRTVNDSVDADAAAKIPFVKAGTRVERESGTQSEQVIRRTRTRFSIFEAWYERLKDDRAIGVFDGWGSEAIADVEAGDTVQFRARLQTSGLETVFKLFGWYVDNSEGKDAFFETTRENLVELRKQRKTMNQVLGGRTDRTSFSAIPVGDAGPIVSLVLKDVWRIGDFGDLDGDFTVVAQVSQIVREGAHWPAIRMIPGAPFTDLEKQVLLDSLARFKDSAAEMGVQVSDSDALVPGPAMIVMPIAIFR